MFGSSSLGFVALSRGSLDIFTGSRKPWDYLPGIPLVAASGGSYFFYEDRCGVIRICAAGNSKSLGYAKKAHKRAGMNILGALPLKLMVAASV
jgi:fructose-1,6-bisphosphatase/inositol monophosphatase family enzyme